MNARVSQAMRWARWFAVLVTVTVGSAAFALSFAALRQLAIMAHVPAGLAWLWPVIVDGTIIQATVSVLVLASSPQRRSFLWVLAAGVGVSITGNSVHAALVGHVLPWWAAAMIAAVAPVSLLVDTHGLAVLFRAAHQDTTTVVPEPLNPVTVEPEPEPVQVSETVAGQPEPVTEPEPVAAVRKPASRWDPDKVARAKALRAEGRSYAEIGRVLEVSPRTAARYANATHTTRTEAATPLHAVRPVQQVLPLATAAVGGA
ncbi:DUF2637 domain-containing protein [Nocardia macrotermitis]|uniref:DUF2637 domain-containing protein n=1 Tax=Nocardia macrotermitis TaxID=2585198 RepID=A0A7K0DA71_9NOCA|nr:DUF2637 domain-containing protein [Nocardia macrotermitis]MQY22670.1 hypothetical protein [Nocardia macrotermitis]